MNEQALLHVPDPRYCFATAKKELVLWLRTAREDEDGLTDTYGFEEGFYNFFQMPYINQNDVLPVVPWMRSAVFYQIFVDRFCRGDMQKDDSYIDMEWGDIPTPKNHAGGDLKERNYECFAACAYMPKLNTANPEVQDFLMEITHYWMELANIDGWRLDVSDEVSHAFWRRFRQEVKGWNKDCVIIGENWHDAKSIRFS